MDDVPSDPFTVLAEGAAQLHELFLSFTKAGFTQRQALYLVGKVLQGATQQPPPQPPT